jgi:hypothetical protein
MGVEAAPRDEGGSEYRTGTTICRYGHSIIHVGNL